MSRRVIAAAGVLLAGVLAVALLLRGGGDGDRYLVHAELADAAGVRGNFTVKLDGLPAGTVERVRITRRDTALLTLALDPEAAPIGRGARLEVRPANLLGEKYVDLRRGDLVRPQPSGTRIPLQRTRTAVDLDELINTLAPTTRAQLRILINEAGRGVLGRGADLNALLARLPSSLREATAVVGQLSADNRRLGDLIASSDRVLAPIAPHDEDLGRFVASFQRLLTNLADKRGQLARTVQQAPGALEQLRGSLDRIDTLAARLTPAAGLLRRSTPSLHATLRELPRSARAAHGTLVAARDVAPSLRRLGDDGVGHVRRLRPTVERLDRFARDLRPVTTSLGRGGVARGAVDMMHGWSRATNRSDGLGHFYRLRLVLTSSAFTSFIERLAREQPRDETRRRQAAVPERRPSTPPQPTGSSSLLDLLLEP